MLFSGTNVSISAVTYEGIFNTTGFEPCKSIFQSKGWLFTTVVKHSVPTIKMNTNYVYTLPENQIIGQNIVL